jgi:hypothetical protein
MAAVGVRLAGRQGLAIGQASFRSNGLSALALFFFCGKSALALRACPK